MVHLDPIEHAEHGFVHFRGDRSNNSKPRNVPLTKRAAELLRDKCKESGLVFAEKGGLIEQTKINHQHNDVRTKLKLSSEFVPHSLRHTFGTRLGEAGADAFTIMRLMGHSTVVVSMKYVQPSSETIGRAVQRMENGGRVAQERGEMVQGSTGIGTGQDGDETDIQ